MTPQVRPCIDEEFTADSPTRQQLVNGVPMWIFDNLDMEGEEDDMNAEPSDQITSDNSSIQPIPTQQTLEDAVNANNQSGAVAYLNDMLSCLFHDLDEENESSDLESLDANCPKPTAGRESSPSISHWNDSDCTVVENSIVVPVPAVQETSNGAHGDVDNGSSGIITPSNPASDTESTSVSRKRTNQSTDCYVTQIPTAIFDTFDGSSHPRTTDETLRDLNCSPYELVPMDSIKLQTFSSESESGCTNQTLNELANGDDDDRSRLPAKRIKLHSIENINIIHQQISNLSTVTTSNSEGSSDLFSYSTPDEDLHTVNSEPTGTSVEPDKHDHVTQRRPKKQPVQPSSLDAATPNESPNGRLHWNAGDFLRPTVEAKIQLHESLRSMLPGLFAKQLTESERFDPLPLIEQKLSLIRLVAAGLKRSYCKNADLGCVVAIASQLAYGNPDGSYLLWRI
ncbi:hypothetical protein AND_002270 [Anopheles darlingi]|uniref:Uncharacterized protein n=1 Tax=Anopheles darlingi TaxID=43151 RepID=W5JRQ8_ANODA|nr:hypothetical protein AND_002270 [Anopheles darlingi]